MTLYLSHPSSLQHDTGATHPESVGRIEAIKEALDALELGNISKQEAPAASKDDILRAHDTHHYESLLELSAQAQKQSIYIDADTIMSKGSFEAALFGAGATIEATKNILDNTHVNAFCATRPPGHHATAQKAMGFCLFNSVAIAAKYAVDVSGLERVAVVDFDVHHGNGTQDIFWSDKRLFYGSTHGEDHYPFSGGKDTTTPDHICNAPLWTGDGSTAFKEAMTQKLLPALINFRPDMIFISAGFDAHKDDPLASLNLEDDDFYWITLKLAEIADHYCNRHIVSTLEGGYNLQALGRSAALHIKALSEAAS